MEEFRIRKKSGEQVLFDENKLRSSLERSGANMQTVNKVIEELYLHVHDGMSTHKVYKKAYSILVKLSYRAAGRYRLKNAIMEFSPTGYPFEKFVAALIRNLGFESTVGQMINGKCVRHEVDVVAENKDKVIVVECKFHHEGKGKSDVKVAMYIRSRFNDIHDQWQKENRINGREFDAWLVTNTRFTEDAERYGKCDGLKMFSWDYPVDNSLKKMIDESGLHPLTTLKNLTKREKKNILDQGVVLCKELTEEVLVSSNINSRKFKKILLEAKNISE